MKFWKQRHHTLNDVGFINLIRNSVRQATIECRIPYTLLRKV